MLTAVPAAEPVGPEFSSLTRKQLVDMCKARGFKISGSKAKLVARLDGSDPDAAKDNRGRKRVNTTSVPLLPRSAIQHAAIPLAAALQVDKEIERKEKLKEARARALINNITDARRAQLLPLMDNAARLQYKRDRRNEQKRKFADEQEKKRQEEDVRRLDALSRGDAQPPAPKVRKQLTHAEKATVYCKTMDGVSVQDIMLHHGVQRRTVYRIVDKFEKDGYFGHAPGAIVGRTPVMTEVEISECARLLQLTQGTIALAAEYLLETYGKVVHPSTIAKNVKGVYGLTYMDFKRVPAQRNTEYAIEARAKYCKAAVHPQMSAKLKKAIYIDEHHFYSSIKKRRGWAPMGVTPHLPGRKGVQPNGLTLYAAVCPDIGLVAHKIVSGLTDATAFKAFLSQVRDTLVAKKLQTTVSEERFIIYDNCGIHAASEIAAWWKEEATIKYKLVNYCFPPYSPFLTPVEEVFGFWDVKFGKRVLELRVELKSKVSSREVLEATSSCITKEIVNKFYEHTADFWLHCASGFPVTSSQILDGLHEGDEAFMARANTEFSVDRILSKFHPQSEELLKILHADFDDWEENSGDEVIVQRAIDMASFPRGGVASAPRSPATSISASTVVEEPVSPAATSAQMSALLADHEE